MIVTTIEEIYLTPEEWRQADISEYQGMEEISSKGGGRVFKNIVKIEKIIRRDNNDGTYTISRDMLSNF